MQIDTTYTIYSSYLSKKISRFHKNERSILKIGNFIYDI